MKTTPSPAQTKAPPQPVRLPREAKICIVDEMEPGEIAWAYTDGIAVDNSDRVWFNARALIFKEQSERAPIRVRRVEGGVELQVPNNWGFARMLTVPFVQMFAVLCFEYVSVDEDE